MSQCIESTLKEVPEEIVIVIETNVCEKFLKWIFEIFETLFSSYQEYFA